MGLLAAILVPIVACAMESGRRTDCRSNIRQLAMQSLIAASDLGEKLPRQFSNPDGVQGEWGNETGGSGSGSDWLPTGLFGVYLPTNELRILRCRSDANFFPHGGIRAASYKHWFNLPQTRTRRTLREPARSVIISEHASNHGRHYALLDEDVVNYATLDGSVTVSRPQDVDYDDVHRWGTLANGANDGPGPLP